MASLLCVIKTICAGTLPFLYKRGFFTQMHVREHSGKCENYSRAQLIRTLLRQVLPQSRIPDILKIAFLAQDDQTSLGSTTQPPQPPSPVFKCGHFIRTLHVELQFIHSMFESICKNFPLMDYAATNRLYEKYVDEGYIDNNVRDEYKAEVLEAVLAVDVYQQLTWTLCQDHTESVDSLKIPLKYIQRYFSHVHRFTSLSFVEFTVGGLGWIRRRMYPHDRTQHYLERRERDRFFRGMMEFVRQHTSIHKNVLRNVRIPYPTDIHGTDQQSHPDVYYAIKSLLPPFPNSRTIHTNWIELLARHTDSDLCRLESVSATTFDREWQDEELSEFLSRYSPLLPRCRALKHLSANTLGPDMFQWAVLEKKQKEAEQQQESIMGQHLSSWYQRHHASDLVPLQSVTIFNEKPSPLGQELNDIAFAFSDSLETMSVYDRARGASMFVDQTTASPVVSHGKGWHLPHLRILCFDISNMKLHFDMDSLQRCRSLESLDMRDDVVTYRHRDISSWLVVRLPRLKKLDLKGSPALYFNMGSLHHSPCLEELTMKMAITNPDTIDAYYLMPSPEELVHEDLDTEGVGDHGPSGASDSSQEYQLIRRRPRYTWDWHLPNLWKLDLAAVFAFMFDLRWLQYLPNLQSLRLDTSSSGRLHERHITLKDVSKKEKRQQSLEEDGSEEILSDRSIRVLKLESIQLTGRWVFEDKALEIIFLVVAPNLHRVEFEGNCTGFTLEECVALSRKMPQMEKMDLRMLSMSDETQRLGIVRWKDVPADQRNKKRVAFRLDTGTFYNILAV